MYLRPALVVPAGASGPSRLLYMPYTPTRPPCSYRACFFGFSLPSPQPPPQTAASCGLLFLGTVPQHLFQLDLKSLCPAKWHLLTSAGRQEDTFLVALRKDTSAAMLGRKCSLKVFPYPHVTSQPWGTLSCLSPEETPLIPIRQLEMPHLLVRNHHCSSEDYGNMARRP